MTSIKSTLITLVIGSIIPLMWGGLALPAEGGNVVMTTQRVQAEPELWWTITKMLVPVACGVIAFIGLAFGWRMLWPTRGGKAEKTPDWFTRYLTMANQVIAPKPQTDEKPAIHWLTINDAINQSSKRQWIIGQAIAKQPNTEIEKRAGELLTLDYQTTQMAILGGTGGGKTESTGQMLIIYAKLYGLHPIVLDGKGGLDWRPYSNVVEWHNLTPQNIADYIQQLQAIYKERHQMLLDANVNSIYKIHEAKRPPTLLVIVEEFGVTWARTKDDQVEIGIDELFRLGRAVGIVLCLIDQAPEKWRQQMRANAKFAVCYGANGQALNAFGEYFCNALPAGVFSRGNVHYRAWHTARLLKLQKMEPLQRRYLMEPVSPAEGVRSPDGGASTRVNTERTLVFSPERTPERTPVATWREWVLDYSHFYPSILDNPPAGIRRLARAMSAHETGSEDNGNRYVGVASETCQLLRQEVQK